MTILDFLYEECCRARLAEMRKQLLLRSSQNDKLPDADYSADRNTLSDDTTAVHYEGHVH
jgi:hypothetical protein